MRAIKPVRYNVFASHGALVAALLLLVVASLALLLLLLAGRRHAGDRDFERQHRLHRTAKSELHRATHLAGIDSGGENAAERARFSAAIEALGNRGIRVVPSQGNFVLVTFGGALSAEAAMEAIGAAGYAVRHLPGQGLGHALRITIGLPEDMDRVAAAIAQAAEAAA